MKTFKEWSSLGYKIKKGSKATWVNNFAMFSKKQVEKVYSQQTYNRAYHSSGNLMQSIKHMSHSFGLPYDDMNNLCEWIVDSEADLYDELGNETDHWMTTRPY